jgi:hypothetical protein
MQVNITFDTEREPIANLTKLRDAINDLIKHREKTHNSLNPLEQRAAMLQSPKPQIQILQDPPSQAVAQPIQATVQQAPKKEQANKKKTSGGCRVVPYEDMSDKMASIFSGGRV